MIKESGESRDDSADTVVFELGWFEELNRLVPTDQ